MSIKIKKHNKLEVEKVITFTAGDQDPREPAIRIGKFTFASPGVTPAEFHKTLRTVSRRVKDMAAKAVADDDAGRTEPFPA